MAGKEKVLTHLAQKMDAAMAELPDIAQRWASSLGKDLKEYTSPEMSESYTSSILNPEYRKKLTNLANEFPEAFRQYEPSRLHEALEDAATGYSDLAVMNPEDFRRLAARDLERYIKEEEEWVRMHPDEPLERAGIDEHLARISRFADMFESGHMFDEVPYLEVETNLVPDIAQVTGHQGRHRNLAQQRLGAQQGLVRIIPRSSRSKKFQPDPSAVSAMDPKAVLHTELSSMQPASEGGGQSYKSVEDVMKFLSVMGFPMGALGDITEE